MTVRLAGLNVLHAVAADYLFIYFMYSCFSDYYHPTNGEAGSENVVVEASACVIAVQRQQDGCCV